MENRMEVSQKVKNTLYFPYIWSNNPTSEYICLKKRKEDIRGICTPICIAILSIMAKIWQKPKCPLMDEWIKKMWYACVCVVVCVCNIIQAWIRRKSYHLLKHVPWRHYAKWNKDKYNMVFLICGILKKKKAWNGESRKVVAKGWRSGRNREGLEKGINVQL